MENEPFVGRERELARLDAFLDAALGGQGQTCFLVGEPGSGKTATAQEFTRRAQVKHAPLVAAIGNCNAQTGHGEPFLPFREVLGMLTGDLEEKLAQGVTSAENAHRVQKLLARSGLILLEVAPALLGTLVSGVSPGVAAALGPIATSAVITPLGKAITAQTGLSKRLDSIIQRKPAGPEVAQVSVEQEHIFEQCTNYLRKLAVEHPLLIVLDDLHWSDASSMNLLFHIGRRLAQSRILIVGTYRPDEVAAGRDQARHPLEKLETEFKRYFGDITIELGQGDDAENRRFVDAYVDTQPNRLGFDFRRALSDLTGGNPLFLVELLRNMEERGDIVKNTRGAWVEGPQIDWTNLPAKVEGVVQERVDRLERASRDLLTVASVEGESFTAEVVAKVQSADEREVVRHLSTDLSKQHRLVDAAGLERLGGKRVSRYRFRHKLVQKYLYDRLDQAERSYLHEDVGKELETLYEGRLDDVMGLLAWHFSEAGLDDKAAGYHRRAGELAAGRYAHDEAVQHFSRALALTADNDRTGRYELLLARESVYNWQGKRQAQAEDLAALGALADAMKDDRSRAEVSLRRASCALLTGDTAAALKYAQEAASQAEKVRDKTAETQAYATLGQVLRNRGDYQEAHEWLELALDSAQDLNDRSLTAHISYLAGLNQYSSDHYERARQYLEQAQAIYRETAGGRGEVNCLLLLGTMQARQGYYGSAISYLSQALEICRKIGWRSREAIILGDLGNPYVEVGDYEAARDYHRQASEIAAEIGDRESEAASLDTLGLIHQHLGRNREALPFFDKALAIQREIGYRRGEAYTLTHRGLALTELGELDAAAQALGQALAIRYKFADQVGASIDDVAGLARIALAQGRPAQALTYVDEALTWMKAHGADSVEYPVLAYLTCYRVLKEAGGDAATAARARTALEDGQALLRKRAASIQDEALREAFLNNVPFNRELIAAHLAAS